MKTQSAPWFAACWEWPRAATLEEGERIVTGGRVGHSVLWFYRDAKRSALDCEDWGAAERFGTALEAA
ncbi:MAG: hypothetical protein QF926_15420 [Alphaproteobacteria bacterium]|nr:hypothetical protein [Alphaproteobacteria bacterium]MDP6517994.1 hypothetical protein [Alphaproteobacteria bacterium]